MGLRYSRKFLIPSVVFSNVNSLGIAPAYNDGVNGWVVAGLAVANVANAQVPPSKQPVLSPVSVAQLAETGHCREALPLLKTVLAHSADPAMQKRLGADGVQCAMSLGDADSAEDFVRALKKRFPRDPEVLYISVHVFSDLSLRASRELSLTAPASYQMHELNAEAMEAQGKLDDAIEEYREVLKKEPNVHGIHYRIGRLLLSEPNRNPEKKEQARREFEEELKINSGNAASEYVLGEMARQDQQMDVAIGHFERATKLDAGFTDAFIGLGRALIEGGRGANALAPLQTAAKLEPNNPAPHLYLATAYRQLGRLEDAQQESEQQREASEKLRQAREHLRAQEAGIAEESK